MNKNYAVLRVIKLKSLADIGRVGKHDSRDKENLPDNVDPKRSKDNLLLKGSGDSTQEFEKMTKGIKRKSDTVLGYDAVLTFSNRVEMDDKKKRQWGDASLKWLEKAFGKDNVVNVWMHNDEDTPHIHAFIIPLVDTDNGKKFNAKFYTGGTVKMQQFQTSYYNAVKQFGLERGIEGSRVKHMSAKEYKKRSEAIKGRLEKMDSTTMRKEYLNALLRIEQLELERQNMASQIGGLEDNFKSSKNDLREAYKGQQEANRKIAYYEQKMAIMRNINFKIVKDVAIYQKWIPEIAKAIQRLPEDKRARASKIDFTMFKNSKEASVYIANLVNPLPERIKFSHSDGYDAILGESINGKTQNFLKEEPAYSKNISQFNYSVSGAMSMVASLFVSAVDKGQIPNDRMYYTSALYKRLEKMGYTKEEIKDYMSGDSNSLKKKKTSGLEMN